MLKDSAFGQFYPTKSFLHNMDPRTKLVLSILYMVAVFMAKSFFGFAFAALFFLLMAALSNVPFRSIIKTVKPILFLLTFVIVINLFTLSEQEDFGVLFFRIGSLRVYEYSVYSALKLVLRFSLVVMGMSIMTFTTSPVDLTSGLESLLRPLNVIHFPVRELALIMSIALRYIPVLMEETDKIIKAQKARGADFDSGNLLKRAKAYIPILIPMFISALKRADELAFAMDSRCYGYTRKPTRMKKLVFTWRDLTAVISFAAVFGGMLFIKYSEARFGGAFPWMYL